MLDKIKALFCLSVVALAVYVAYSFGMPYYNYSIFKSDVEDIVKYDTLIRENEVKKAIMKNAKTNDIPLEDYDLIISKAGEGFDAKASWSVTVDILGQYQKTIDFSFDTSQPGG